MLLTATVLITLALILYTIGVWAERIARYLKPWHLGFFWTGLACDVAGTYAMELINGRIVWTSWHAITGFAAVVLMAVHTVWATVVVVRNDEHSRQVFHHYSLAVWVFWLVPFIGGMIAGMMGTPLA